MTSGTPKDAPSAASASADAARKFYRNDSRADFYAKDRFAGRRKATDSRDKRALERALDLVGAEGRVLDCPCGAGRITPVLRSRGLDVTGMDVSLQMLKQAAALHDPYRPVQGDALVLPFRDASFDTVVSMRFLYHLAAPAERVTALAEMARVSKRYLIISFFDSRTLQSVEKKLKVLAGRKPALRVEFSKAQFEREAATGGWKVLKFFPTLAWVSQHTVVALEKMRTGP